MQSLYLLCIIHAGKREKCFPAVSPHCQRSSSAFKSCKNHQTSEGFKIHLVCRTLTLDLLVVLDV